ncbi:hypothetical protein SAMN02746065_110109 [Desulfocicer vacuolatum DSM 3385]|uniref:Porin n=1 Tax=Desulfocicer vacuolatum DSM 3385 TaxID=1121400 RepID=A0A1W2C3M7_9BACT|nr:hypothetical protein [Desulfocicer vacuolatum]SMC79624.1 hypothetical protein SAMN02746065_110109 [Desulfocicer vacuolatum DSM 3385]
MKKLAIALFAVVCMAMFIAPAYADDRVSLSGSMRVRAWSDNYTDGSDASWWDQRFRIKTKINVADDVYAVLRADYGEGQWGVAYNGLITRPRATKENTLDIDRGYLNIDKEMWSLRAGQQYLGLGILQVLDANATAVKLTLKMPVKTSLIYIKETENGSTNDDGAFDDSDVYAVNFSYDTDAFSTNLFAITRDDNSAVDDSATMFGFNGSASLGMVDLTGELAFAAGDTADGAVDYVGTQFYLKAAANLSDAFSMGGELLYALGTDDADEQQLTGLCNWWSFVPMASNTPFDADISAFANADAFDPTGANAGVQGITLFGKFNVMDALSLGAKVGYFTPEEDDNTATDDITAFNVWASYMIATNTELAITYLYSDYDNLDDNYDTLVARLQVNF